MQKAARMKRELEMLHHSPPPGVACSQDHRNKNLLKAQIFGGEGTPYHGGLFYLDVTVPDRYPFEPPKVIFKTPIYHPNIDDGGRICLDTLKMPPQGAWKPSLNIGSVLTMIQLLMAEPNPDDPLMTDISSEFKFSRHTFNEKAKQWTRKYAMGRDKGSVGTTPKASDFVSGGSESGTGLVCRKVVGGEAAGCSGTGSNSRKRSSIDNDCEISRKRR